MEKRRSCKIIYRDVVGGYCNVVTAVVYNKKVEVCTAKNAVFAATLVVNRNVGSFVYKLIIVYIFFLRSIFIKYYRNIIGYKEFVVIVAVNGSQLKINSAEAFYAVFLELRRRDVELYI